jgi:hypothetical protein
LLAWCTWFAVASRDAPIFGLPKTARSAAKSATSSTYHYAEGTIVSCIVTVMKQRGGTNSAPIRPAQLGRYGFKRIRAA